MRSSKKTILLILLATVATVIASTVVSVFLSRTANLHVPSLGTIKTLGVEAYWDAELLNNTKSVNWGTIWPGSSRDITLFLRSISSTDSTLYVGAENWNPSDIASHMNLMWNYNGTVIHPSEVIEVTLTLSTSASDSFMSYLETNDINQFSFDIVIGTS